MKDKSFVYTESDAVGEESLRVISQADKFNAWMYKSIEPFISGKTLEIGSGIGNISGQVLAHGTELFLSDIRPHYCEQLLSKYGQLSNFLGVAPIDLVHPDFVSKYSEHIGVYDSVFTLNVIEHIENDALAVQNASLLLKPGGILTVLVPAFGWLYNQFDRELMHYRRYTGSSLQKKIRACESLSIKQTFYFNSVAVLGWFFSGAVLRKSTIPEGQMQLYNFLVPALKFVDRIFLRKFGLSVVTVCIKMK